MNWFVIIVAVCSGIGFLIGCWLGWQLLRQNGRILLRLDELEKRLDELENDEHGGENLNGAQGTDAPHPDDRASRFHNRSLARSKIKRDGLKAGTPAPDFRLPRLDGKGDLSLSEFRGKRVLLVFSSPSCGPCNALAPELENFHRSYPELDVLMISKGEAGENRVKVKEHGLSFPIVMQQQWEFSRRYAMFATPIAYLIDEAGTVAAEVAVGVEAIRGLMRDEARSLAAQNVQG